MPTIVPFPPTLRAPGQAKWRAIYNVLMHQARFTRTVSTVEIPGRTFYAECTWDLLDRNEIALIESWYGKMRGSAGRFYMSPPHAIIPRGAAGTMIGYTPRLNGINPSAMLTLATDGWQPSVTNLFLEGDYVAFDNSNGGRELKIITANCSSDALGQMTIPIDDAVRIPAPDNNLVIYNPPSALMLIYESGGEDSGIELEPPILGSWKLSAVEAY